MMLTCPHGIPYDRADLVCQHCDAIDSSSVAVVGDRPEHPKFDSTPRESERFQASVAAGRKDDPQQSPELLGVSDPESRKKQALEAAARRAQDGYEGVRDAMRELRATAPELYRKFRNGRDDDVLERVRLFAAAIAEEAERYDPEKEREELP